MVYKRYKAIFDIRTQSLDVNCSQTTWKPPSFVGRGRGGGDVVAKMHRKESMLMVTNVT